jgi:hypothetical protein
LEPLLNSRHAREKRGEPEDRTLYDERNGGTKALARSDEDQTRERIPGCLAGDE